MQLKFRLCGILLLQILFCFSQEESTTNPSHCIIYVKNENNEKHYIEATEANQVSSGSIFTSDNLTTTKENATAFKTVSYEELDYTYGNDLIKEEKNNDR